MQRGVLCIDRNGEIVKVILKPFASWTIRGVCSL